MHSADSVGCFIDAFVVKLVYIHFAVLDTVCGAFDAALFMKSMKGMTDSVLHMKIGVLQAYHMVF